MIPMELVKRIYTFKIFSVEPSFIIPTHIYQTQDDQKSGPPYLLFKD